MNATELETAGIIHDLRNLLLVISANCSILTDDSPTEKSHCVEEISKATDTMEKMLSDLGESQRSEVDKPQGVLPTIKKAVEFAETIYPGVEFNFLREELSLQLDIDSDDLFRIALNLILNAAEAASERKEPLVQIFTSNDKRRLGIVDNGFGFQHQAKDVFAPYVTSRRCPSVNHAGLGLYVVESIAARHGASIMIHSEAGKTVVEIVFPKSHCPIDLQQNCSGNQLQLARQPVKP